MLAALPLVGAVMGVAAVTFLSGPGPAPDSSPTAVAVATPTPSPTPTETPTPTLTPIAFPSAQDLQSGAPPVGPDPDAVPTIWAAVGRLTVLERYRFVVAVSGRSVENLSADSRVDFAVRGVLVRKPVLAVDAVMSFRMVEASGDAAFSATDRFLLIGDTSWRVRPGESPRPSKLEPGSTRQFETFIPDGIVQRTLLPFADGYAKVGEELRNGVATVHYRATQEGLRKYLDVLRINGSCSADLWIAKNEGYLAAALMQCTPTQVNAIGRGGFFMQLDVTDVNDSGITVVAPR
jgi:hypothetical protein